MTVRPFGISFTPLGREVLDGSSPSLFGHRAAICKEGCYADVFLAPLDAPPVVVTPGGGQGGPALVTRTFPPRISKWARPHKFINDIGTA